MEAPRPKAIRPVIGLLTDFGLQDHYVGVMKAVIASIAPEALTIDVSHDVPPQNVLAGQLMLRSAMPYFPAGAVFLTVVDPGVGTARRPMALSGGQWTFVGPDNGLFTPWLDGGQAVELTSAEYRLPEVSSTFHGRDVFAPAAAHLALGVELSRLGPPLADPVRLDPPRPVEHEDGTIDGEIVYVDRFGNLISNIALAEARGTAQFLNLELPVQPTYGAAERGKPLALVGSDGCLEIAVRDGSAAQLLEVGVGQPVRWHE